MYSYSTKGIQHNKKTEELRKKLKSIFQAFSAFIECTEQQLLRHVDNDKRKMYYSLGKKKRHTLVKNQIMVNNCGYIIHKVAHKKGKRHDYIFNI